MNFIKKFFNHDDIIIGLVGIRKDEERIKKDFYEKYKKTYIINTAHNYLL